MNIILNTIITQSSQNDLLFGTNKLYWGSEKLIY